MVKGTKKSKKFKNFDQKNLVFDKKKDLKKVQIFDQKNLVLDKKWKFLD